MSIGSWFGFVSGCLRYGIFWGGVHAIITVCRVNIVSAVKYDFLTPKCPIRG